MSPPTIAGWSLALRFGLEMTALVGLALAGWQLGASAGRWLLMVLLPLGAAAVWTVFNVPGDPSRSGEAPVVVTGRTRLLLELAVLVAGTVALATVAHWLVPFTVAALTAGHYAASWSRVGWLLDPA